MRQHVVNKRILSNRGMKELDQLKVTCKCGHVVVMPVFKDFIVCNYCGNRVNNNTKLYFKYKLRMSMDAKLKELNENRKR